MTKAGLVFDVRHFHFDIAHRCFLCSASASALAGANESRLRLCGGRPR
ncbi:MAG: hypothetical protein LBQ10_05115 [Desulfovibrio sp.]|jgi:hypothetical protein|nr:hypothetical protein [Desulfovibrio sp.]